MMLFGLANISYATSSFEIIENPEVVNEPSPFTGEVVADFDFKNNSKQTKTVVPSIIVDKITNGHKVAVCLYYCFAYTSEDWTTDESVDMPSDSKMSEILGFKPTAHCMPNAAEGQTKVRFRFADANFPEDYIDIPMTFNFGITGVDDVKPKEFVVAYPNPTNGVLSVYSEVLDIESIKIFDVSGKEMISETATNNYKTLDLSSLAKGSYVMRISLSDGTIKSQSVIIE